MDSIAEKLSVWFGSVPFILAHTAWFIAWFVFKLPTDLLTLIVSLEAIYLSMFILRAEKIQGDRMERSIKQNEKDTKKDLQESVKLKALIRRKK